MRPKQRAWPFLGRDRILQKSLWISDERDTFVSKNDFWKKSWVNYEAPAVQIWPASNWIGKILSFFRGVYKTFSMQTIVELCIIYGIMFSTIWLFNFCNIFLVDASQKIPIFALRKWKNWFFCITKIKTSHINIVFIPKCTHVHNMRSFEQTMSWLWP
jgi:hypothetical protein